MYRSASSLRYKVSGGEGGSGGWWGHLSTITHSDTTFTKVTLVPRCLHQGAPPPRAAGQAAGGRGGEGGGGLPWMYQFSESN